MIMSPGAPGRNGTVPSAIGADVDVGVVGVVDAGERVDDVVGGDTGDDVSSGEPDGVAHEQEPVASGDVVEVDAAVDVVTTGGGWWPSSVAPSITICGL